MAHMTNETDRNNHTESSKNSISIWQQNVNRSHTCQHDLISSTVLTRRGIYLVALQELVINNFGTTIASREWTLVYPSTHTMDLSKTHSLLLVRSNVLTERWKQIDFPSGDIIIINISGSWGKATIYNIYNDCDKNNMIHQLESFVQSQLPLTDQRNNSNESVKVTLWLGDFNRHHPHWDNLAYTILFTRSTV
jgi:hypothetical protein